MSISVSSIKLAALTVLFGAAAAAAQRGNISSDLQQALSAKGGMSTDAAAGADGTTSASLIDVIVQYKTAPASAQYQRVSSLGGTLKTQYGAVYAAHYGLPKSAVQTLAGDSEVAYISLDRAIWGSNVIWGSNAIWGAAKSRF